MIPFLIYLLEMLRRAMRRANRGLVILASAFAEAMEDWRTMKKKYPFAE
jgi:hypothetical protein